MSNRDSDGREVDGNGRELGIPPDPHNGEITQQEAGGGIKLKPCPFCCGTDLRIIDKSDSFRNKYARAVFCQGCHCTGSHVVQSGWTESDDDVTQKWNERAADRKLTAVYAALNELLDTSGARGVYDGQAYLKAKRIAEELLNEEHATRRNH